MEWIRLIGIIGWMIVFASPSPATSSLRAAHDGIDAHAHRNALPQFAQAHVVGSYPDVGSAKQNLQRLLAQSESAFTMIGLPDTQNYSEFYPSTFLAQTNWVASQRLPKNIRFVSHFGDVVNHASVAFEWQNAEAAMSVLDEIGVIYGVCPGNHDITPSGIPGTSYIPQHFAAHFGPQRFAQRPWFGGASPSGMSSFAYFNAGGIPFLALHLDCDTPVSELAWAQGILDTHKDRPALVTTHKYLQDAEDYISGVPVVASGRYPPSWYALEDFYNPAGIQSDELYLWFLRKNTNIFLVQCGHFHEEYRQSSLNVAGQLMHEVLADFQDDPNGGNGWMRILTFDTIDGTIDFDTFSPTLGAVRTADESDFTLSVPFENFALPSGVQFRAFQQGISGYLGTRDTWISEAAPNTSYGDNSTRVSDDDVNNAFFSDARGQALVRFDEIFSAQKIPLTATILSATLVLDISDDIDSPIYDPDFFVYLVERAWEENSTWNSLTGGLTVGTDLGLQLGVFTGDNAPDSDSMRRIDLTSAVTSWQHGHPNHGVAIMPEIIAGNDDGIAIRTSENVNTILRPRLEVTFVSSAIPLLADLTGDRIVNAGDLAILLSAWETPHPFADLNYDGTVGAADLAMMLAAWT